MLFHVLSGRRGFSDKTLDRLVECEVAAGVRSQASGLIESGLRGNDLFNTLLGEEAQSQVAIHDIDVGSKELDLVYRRGSPPPGFPIRTTVKAANNATIWRIIGEKGTRENPSKFLAACLPDLQDKPEVLERLTPSCYALILDTALDLSFGLNWRSKLKSSRGIPGKKPGQDSQA